MVTREKKPSGLLNIKSSREKFTLSLHFPSPDLDYFIEHFWIVKWDLTDQEPYLSENVPHPCVHLVFENDRSRIVGVTKQKFAILLKDQGSVFGIKFRPGAFYPFVNMPVYKLTGRSVPFRELFQADHLALDQTILSLNDEQDMVGYAETFLRGILPEQDDNISLIKRIVDHVITDRTVTRVEDIVSRFHLNKRMLQRIFSKYVGVTPKWVIQRYRLLEIADQLANGNPQSWPQLAVELGYYDQSHFIKDFKYIVGRSLEDYVRNAGTTAGK